MTNRSKAYGIRSSLREPAHNGKISMRSPSSNTTTFFEIAVYNFDRIVPIVQKTYKRSGRLYRTRLSQMRGHEIFQKSGELRMYSALVQELRDMMGNIISGVVLLCFNFTSTFYSRGSLAYRFFPQETSILRFSRETRTALETSKIYRYFWERYHCLTLLISKLYCTAAFNCYQNRK